MVEVRLIKSAEICQCYQSFTLLIMHLLRIVVDKI